MSITFDNPTLTEAQLTMLRDCLVDEHTVTVADNSRTKAGATAIRDICRRMDVEYVRLHRNPYTGRDPSRSHAEALRAAARHLRRLCSVEVLGFLDHDIFPTNGTSVLSHMAGHDAYGTRTPGRGCWYLWPGLLFVRPEVWPPRSLDFAPVHGRGDTGCALYFSRFHHHPEDRIAFTHSHHEPINVGDRELLLEWHDTWIHTLNGSYWKSAARKEDLVIEALQGFGLRTGDGPS